MTRARIAAISVVAAMTCGGCEAARTGEAAGGCTDSYGCPIGSYCDGGVCAQAPDGCQGIPAQGCCSGNTAVACSKGKLTGFDCGAASAQCGWLAPSSAYMCVPPSVCTAVICEEISGAHPFACPLTSSGCVIDCTDRQCGNDGCGGACGDCKDGFTCSGGRCLACAPTCLGRQCGDDGCGGSCGKCSTHDTCGSGGQCQACVKKCPGKQCGSDGCGGSCGICTTGQVCSAGSCVACQPKCTGKTCGSDGCGGSCGSCKSGYSCSSGSCKKKSTTCHCNCNCKCSYCSFSSTCDSNTSCLSGGCGGNCTSYCKEECPDSDCGNVKSSSGSCY